MPRVSVIVPAFDAAATVEETLQSVVAQTFDDWEVVLTDDGSRDGTAELAGAVDPRVRVLPAGRSGGPARARNLAISQARGELLAFLDADDLWLPDYLGSQTETFDVAQSASGSVGVVACDARLLGPGGLQRGTYRDHAPFPEPLTLARLLESNPVFISALSPRAVVEKVGGFDPLATFGAEDHNLWIKIMERGYRIVYNPRPVAVYRVGASSMSSSLVGMSRTSQEVYRLALQRGRLNPLERRVASRSLRLQRAVDDVECLIDDRMARRSPLAIARAARGGLVFLLFAARHPERWPRWAKALLGGRATLWRPELR